MPVAWVQYAGGHPSAVGERHDRLALGACRGDTPRTNRTDKEIKMRSTQTAMRCVTTLVWLTMVPLVTECHAQGQTGPAQRSPQPKPIEGVVTAEPVASGLEHPWAL